VKRLAALAGALTLWAAPVAAYEPFPCTVLNDDGTVSQFISGYPAAELADETDAYGHAVLGDAIEYRTLRVVTGEGPPLKTEPGQTHLPRAAFGVTLPAGRVFEDIEARVVPVIAESWVIDTYRPPAPHDNFAVVETEAASGASLAIYRIGCDGVTKVAATPPIGTAYRWLAPAGIEDFDGDGNTDIAYVETPHLRGILKIVSMVDGALQPIIAPMPGFSNHAIGQDFITSGVRRCRPRPIPMAINGWVQAIHPEILVPSRDRTMLHAVRIENGALVVEDRPEPPTPDGIRAAQICSPEELAQ